MSARLTELEFAELMNKRKVKQYLTSLDFLVPVRAVSEANQREHWAVKYKRKNLQQAEILAAMHQNLRGRRVRLPCKVILTRIGPKALDVDNLAGSLKHVQDAVAMKLGVDDGNTKVITWEYQQMPIKTRDYAVKISITSLE